MKMLTELVDLLNKYDIQYYMIGGSLIGAMRHQGFIPWDDDIDLGMTRENYDRFLNIIPAQLNANYFLQTDESEEGYALSYAKLTDITTNFPIEADKNAHVRQGIFIDIFPYDVRPVSKLGGLIQYFFYEYYDLFEKRRLGYGHHDGPKSKMMMVLQNVTPWVTTDKIKNKRKKWMTKYNNKLTTASEFINLSTSYGYADALMKREELSIMQTQFEQVEVSVSQRFDDILTREYGDWRKLPDESEQKSTHFQNTEEI